MENIKKIVRPILVVPAISNEKGIVFFATEKKIIVKNNIEIIWELLNKCDGHKSIEEICDNELEESIINELLKRGVMCDSSEQYKHFHKISNNPQNYRSITDFEDICKKREVRKSGTKEGEKYDVFPDENSEIYRLQCVRTSCRSFLKDTNVSLHKLGEICDCAYSRNRHATPSGGNLYPLYIYCVVQYEQPDLAVGVYEYDAIKNRLVRYKDSVNQGVLPFCYNDETNAFNSPIQMIICADLDIQGEKYSNLGYRLTLMEIGHVAQNVVLYCAESGLDTCELGGILETPLMKELELDNEIKPILAIAIGNRASDKLLNYPDLLKKLQKKYVGADKVVKAVGIHKLGSEATIFGAWAKFGNHDKNIAGATGKSTHSALSKAIIEAYERYRSGIVRVDYEGVYKAELNCLSPNQIAPIDSNIRKTIGLEDYVDGETVISWTRDISGKMYIPTDYVFYGNSKKAMVLYGNSSGVAAYTDYSTAKKKAAAELIERDAVMRCWYEKKTPAHISMEQVPAYIVEKIDRWREQGRNVHILYLESEILKTFLCIIESDKYPFFVSGSSTSIGNVFESIEKSYQEAEYNLLLAIRYPCVECPKKESVKSPSDHGQYYHFKDNACKLKWLWNNNESVVVDIEEDIDFEYVYEELDISFVDLTDSEDDFIKVVRAVSPRLIPIGFGYNRDFPLHPRIKNLCIGDEKEPHFFA